MTLLLVRHAVAVPGAAWTGSDRDRPLTVAGERQAEQLIDLCAPYRIERMVCSPARRCVQTLQPLARARGVAVEQHPDLGEGRRTSAREVLTALSETDAVVCTHADVLDAFVRRLMRLGLALADPPRWANAEAWMLDQHTSTPSLTQVTPTPT